MAVGEDGGVGPGQVHPQTGGVFQQGGGGPGVQQAAPAVLLDEKGETVLTAQGVVGGGVLDQRGDFHAKALLSRGRAVIQRPLIRLACGQPPSPLRGEGPGNG